MLGMLMLTILVCGGPRRIRTPDPLIRSQVLYPAELSVRRAEIALGEQGCKGNIEIM